MISRAPLVRATSTPGEFEVGGYSFFVPGTPKPQGSKTCFCIKGRGVMVEQADRKTKHRPAGELKAWRAHVVDTYKKQAFRPSGKYWKLACCFTFLRPPSHFTPKGALKKSAPLFPGKPDMSHLIRAVEDALTTAGAWSDDARVVAYGESPKVYGAREGVLIFLSEVLR